MYAFEFLNVWEWVLWHANETQECSGMKAMKSKNKGFMQWNKCDEMNTIKWIQWFANEMNECNEMKRMKWMRWNECNKMKIIKWMRWNACNETQT